MLVEVDLISQIKWLQATDDELKKKADQVKEDKETKFRIFEDRLLRYRACICMPNELRA